MNNLTKKNIRIIKKLTNKKKKILSIIEKNYLKKILNYINN